MLDYRALLFVQNTSQIYLICFIGTRIKIMNCEVFQLKELEVEPYQIREVLRCILHTIVFHRALGVVRPKDVDLDLFEITYVQCGDSELEKKIEEKIDQFVSWVEKHPNKKSQICLSFYEIRNKSTGWFGNRAERFYWEQWYITMNVITSKAASSKSHHGKAIAVEEVTMEDGNPRHAALELALRDVLFQIIQYVNEKKDHIPPVQNSDAVSFPCEIAIPSTSDSSFGMDMFKRMLQTGTPGMLS
ncbi:autophagy-related protein 101 [Cryptomeria japonica]|uniref:autophagy-related protein 101 n=1 Tax=Cryptomeria japonica TaxID=3369 RepID=UPI0027DA50A3|nr:autophagy-related protein 101 [Cryptomeria japonica]XP_057868469.2 autophagy-related protein 101 [Cryptomeria japonica]XP_057868470.2 autophagy-related protein 101 [Cryptomeria japonica]XP_059063319.1 autophagy-related protein 101 [Cryptomeria japonica]